MRRFAGSPLASALKEAIENGNRKKIEELCDSVPFQCLNFSTRAKNCLMFSGAQSIGDVVRLIESGKLKNLRQCGQGALQNIIDVLEKTLPFHFILGKPAQFCPETSDAFTRKECTRELSTMLERYIDPRNDPRIYSAREVTLDYSTNHNIGVLCPDGGHLRCVRKAVRKDRTRPVSEMLLMLWRSSRREIVARREKHE